MTRFVPHVPRTNATHAPAVWAIDPEHAPLYWFPRDCPRVTTWPRTADEEIAFRAAFRTSAPRVHGIELGWLDRMRTAVLYAYELDPADFQPWPAASGQWIATRPVVPLRVVAVGDLLDAHVAAGIELRAVPSLLAAPRPGHERSLGLQHRAHGQRRGPPGRRARVLAPGRSSRGPIGHDGRAV